MSTKNQQEQAEQSQPQEQAEVTSVPFNPFTALPADAITALAGNFNKAWRSTHALTIMLAMEEFKISENDATFYAWIRSEANGILDRNAVSDTVKYISNMLEGVAFPNSTDVTLALIEQRYSALKVELRKTAGIRIRDYATGKWASVTAQAILSKVYEKLGIVEKDWMR